MVMTTQKMNDEPLVYNGAVIKASGDHLNLTDMWKAAAAPNGRGPNDWLASADAARFIEFLAETLNAGNSGNGENQGISPKVGNSHFGLVNAVRGGNNPRTEAHWQIGLAYAKYLSPEFHVWCNTVVREHMEGKSPIAAADTEIARRLDGMVKIVAHKVTGIERMASLMAEAMARMDTEHNALAEQVRSLVVTSDHRHVASDYVSPLDIAIKHGAPPKGRRTLARVIGDQMARISADWEVPVKLGKESGKRLFSPHVALHWENHGGRDFIVAHNAKTAGQGTLNFAAEKARRMKKGPDAEVRP